MRLLTWTDLAGKGGSGWQGERTGVVCLIVCFTSGAFDSLDSVASAPLRWGTSEHRIHGTRSNGFVRTRVDPLGDRVAENRRHGMAWHGMALFYVCSFLPYFFYWRGDERAVPAKGDSERRDWQDCGMQASVDSGRSGREKQRTAVVSVRSTGICCLSVVSYIHISCFYPKLASRRGDKLGPRD